MLDLIKRNTPLIADSFVLKTIPSLEGKNVFSVYCENGKIVIEGDCKISQAQGYYEYLKAYCNAYILHGKGFSENIASAPLFEGKIEKVIEQKTRFCFSFETYGYSLDLWGRDEWVKEIDLLAMNGINMALCLVGSQGAWYYTLREFKYSENGALNCLSGPGFWFRQLTDNLSGYFALTDVKYIESRVKLGREIIDQMVSLGITPVLPGYCGGIPGSIKKLYKQSKINLMPSWNNFPFTYVVNPEDPLFKKFGCALLEKQRQLFGSYHYFAVAPFYNRSALQFSGSFRSDKGARNNNFKLAKGVDSVLKEIDKDYVCVVPSVCASSQFIKGFSKENILICDEYSKYAALTDDFWGYNYIAGLGIENPGNKTVLNGSIERLAENKFSSKKENCVGTGFFGAGLLTNPLYNDLLFEMLTAKRNADIKEYLASYAKRKYKSEELCLVKGLEKLVKSCYGENCNERETGSILCMRPCTSITHTAIGDELELKYDNLALLSAIDLLLQSEKASGDGYEMDICDFTRQASSNKLREVYADSMRGFEERDVNLFEKSANKFLKICDEMDAMLLTREEFSLSYFLSKSGAMSFNDKDKENFELNLLTKLTLFGPVADPVIYACAWKEWSGLIETYYSKRWQSFYERLSLEFPKRRSFSTVTRKQPNGRNDYKGNSFYKYFADFEKNWLAKVNPCPCNSENTIKKAKILLDEIK